MGSNGPQPVNGRSRVPKRERSPFILELKTADLGIRTFTKLNREVSSIHLRMENTTSLYYLAKRGDNEPQINRLYEANLVLRNIRKGYSYARICFFNTQQNCRLRIKKFSGF